MDDLGGQKDVKKFCYQAKDNYPRKKLFRCFILIIVYSLAMLFLFLFTNYPRSEIFWMLIGAVVVGLGYLFYISDNTLLKLIGALGIVAGVAILFIVVFGFTIPDILHFLTH